MKITYNTFIMKDQFTRMRLVIGDAAFQTLRNSTVAVFGVGGVGGSCVEALARSGVGKLVLIDNDEVSVTNINRQMVATLQTIGKPKVIAAKERIHSIDPSIEVECIQKFYLPDSRDEFDFTGWDYIIDAIDTVSAKLDIIVRADELGIPLLSSMGCGNRLDPSKLYCTDIFSTKNDPLAKVMRRELRKRHITSLRVVCSSELPQKVHVTEGEQETLPQGKRAIPGSTAFVPPAAGLLLASIAVRDLTEKGNTEND